MDEPTMMGHVLLRWSHIAAGTLSLVAGFTAMALRKGAARHALAGRVYAAAARTTRHLTRISLAMFMATMSFFIGQSRHLPAAVRETRLNLVPVLLVIGALLYWVVRIRVLPLIRRRRRAVVPA